MKNVLLRKALVLGIMLVFAVVVFVPSTYGNILSENSVNIEITVRTNGDKTEINYQINNFIKLPVSINGKAYSRILLNGESNILSKGAPDVPNICRSIIIPDTAKMGIRVISSKFEEYKNVPIAPSKGNLPRTVDPDKIPYEFGSLYKINDWYPKNIAELSDPYILRDFRGQVVKINPIQYNPITKTMRFYKDITVEIYPVGTDTLNCINRGQLPSKVDANFKQIYENHFINFNNLGRYNPVGEQGKMLVITYDNFWDNMLPFVQWKNMKGVPTEMVNVSTIGDANAIKTYISEYYNTNGLTFVLLVGDAVQVPTLYAGGGASDPSYSYIVGNDHYPDLFVGRFSAENIAQVETQVNRTVTYERDPQVGAEWYKKGVGIGSEYGVGDDGEYDYQHIRNIRTLLLNFTYSYIDEFYGGTQGGLDAPGEPTTTMISTALNEGRSIINYCGHGSPTSWGTSGFSNTNVNALTNNNMLPFITSVACNNGEFDDTTCFGEAWLRATHNGQPTGAIGAYMSSVSQSWDPPMEAQDEFNNILIGLYANNTKTTFGGLCYNGAMSMNDKYGADGWAMTDAWIVFGDPSVQVRTDTPATMTVSHVSEIEQGTTTFEVTVDGVEGALCAISRNYVLIGYAYTDATGHATITFAQPMSGGEPLDLVVTAFNKMPYMAQITVITNNPPDKPATPTGPASGKPGTSYLYTTSTTDPDEDQIFYMWDWGDGNLSGWLGPFNSGATATATHSWSTKGNYNIKVKAKDNFGAESDWSDPLPITMPLEFPSQQQSGNYMALQILKMSRI